MASILLHPGYFAPVSHYALMSQATEVVFEDDDNYQKQTYRNRTYIYGANGKLLLNIPIKHSKDGKHQKYRDVKVENNFEWQKLHWKSLQSAYRSSPFFEYYEDDFAPLFEQKQKFLLDFNYKCFEVVSDNLQWDITYTKTEEYFMSPEQVDLRHSIAAKKPSLFSVTPYYQVFEEKKGFLPDLSILDLLFNEGTNALSYLESQDVEKLMK